ncbi:hypothetical protein NS183_02925 [Microbacterium testaceum]|uniref:hypothetical protein n=1 Tax=Microbacterium testaceum TaxID=2033 RepID=UPI000734119D|nr:hypothetical protein [Microbacterium testaceum]KTS91728.1 hypothetical protein NS183_02925 [Microbacterium testaceum]
MATDKQADLIVRLVLKLGKCPPAQAAEARLQALALTPAATRAKIDELNGLVGFDRAASPATDRQRSFILDLESKAYGSWKTKPTERLTYAEADERIKLLQKVIAGQTAAPVIDLFSKRAV